MKTRYETRGFWKDSEQDIFNEGCQPGTGAAFSDETTIFSEDTLEELVEKIMEFCDTDDKRNVMLNACDEKGRIDVQVMERGDGTAASERNIIEWKQGFRDLWLCNYTFHVHFVTAEPVDLTTIKNSSEYCAG